MNTWTWKRSHGCLLEDHLDRPRSPCFSWAWRCPSRASGPCCRCQWRRPPGTWARRSAEPPAGPGLTDEYTTREVTDQPAFSHCYLCETFFAVPPSVVAFKLELPGRPRKILDTIRVKLQFFSSWGWSWSIFLNYISLGLWSQTTTTTNKNNKTEIMYFGNFEWWPSRPAAFLALTASVSCCDLKSSFVFKWRLCIADQSHRRFTRPLPRWNGNAKFGER